MAPGRATSTRAPGTPATTLTALWVAELFEDAGLPAGVLQVVTGGPEVGAAVIDHVDAVVFTGSTRSGREVAAHAGARMIPTTLELGGKNGVYVANDVDPAVTASGLVRTCFAGVGQVCVTAERLYVHESVYDDVVEAFVDATERLRLGAGLDYRAQMGSLSSATQLARVVEHVEDAVGAGARLLAGGEQRPELGPYFYSPTILADVPAEARLAREETFGPVVAVYRVASDDEAVAAVNDTEYGLAAGVWTSDERRGWSIARRLRAGSVSVNEAYVAAWAPIGAPQAGWGSSGLGARHGREALLAATRPQTIALQHGTHGLVGRRGPGIGLDRTVFGLGADVWTPLYTGALRAMKALRIP